MAPKKPLNYTSSSRSAISGLSGSINKRTPFPSGLAPHLEFILLHILKTSVTPTSHVLPSSLTFSLFQHHILL